MSSTIAFYNRFGNELMDTLQDIDPHLDPYASSNDSTNSSDNKSETDGDNESQDFDNDDNPVDDQQYIPNNNHILFPSVDAPQDAVPSSSSDADTDDGTNEDANDDDTPPPPTPPPNPPHVAVMSTHPDESSALSKHTGVNDYSPPSSSGDDGSYNAYDSPSHVESPGVHKPVANSGVPTPPGSPRVHTPQKPRSGSK